MGRERELTPRLTATITATRPPSYGLMLAYNQFSSNTPHCKPRPGWTSAAWGHKDRDPRDRRHGEPGDELRHIQQRRRVPVVLPDRPGRQCHASDADPAQDAHDVATRICALTTDPGSPPGYATPRTPVLIHTLAFGAVFEPTASGSEPANAVAFLQNLSTIGGTVVSQFGERSRQRLQMVHWYACRSAIQAATGVHEDFGRHRRRGAGEVKIGVESSSAMRRARDDFNRAARRGRRAAARAIA